MKPRVHNQGKFVIDYDVESKLYYMMTPDGDTSITTSKKEAKRAAARWAKKNSDPDAVNVLKVEWRNCKP